MAVGMKQSLNLSQTLRMTPQLQQAIKLLQLSRLELEGAIRKELDENPVLEESADLRDNDSNRADEPAQGREAEVELNAAQDPQRQDEFEWENYMDSQFKPQQQSGPGYEDIGSYENVIATAQTLHEHLHWQASLFGFNDEEQTLISILISYVDDDGYIKTPLQEIAREESVSEEDLASMFTFLHEFDPPGVGARDLQECLLVQAKQIQEDTQDVVHLIKNHLKELERKNYDGIAKAMNRSVDEVTEICKIVYAMEPKPGRLFVRHDTHYVTPDVYVYKVGDEYIVSLNEDGLPRLKISNFYRNVLKNGVKGDNTQDYIQDKLRSAVWLIKSIQQRQRTIYKVTESIVKYQQEFFDKGPAFIKPMILRDIANDIGMHESTVSRVTNNKYVHTPRGIFELKYFFNSGISTDDGDSLASESVKLRIKDMVGKEDPRDPLSDQKLVELLKKDGIQIARRTVAKYRDMLKILPSSKRKKYF